jgi:hypothetical protein
VTYDPGVYNGPIFYDAGGDGYDPDPGPPGTDSSSSESSQAVSDSNDIGDASSAGQGPGGGECFTGPTLIDMFDGSKKQICKIQIGDLVKDALTGAANKVIGIKVTDYEVGRRIFATRKGEEPYITEQHAFYNEQGELCAMSEECEYLAPWLGPIKIVDVPVIKTVKEPITVYNLMFESGNSHFANGLPVSNIVGTGNMYVLFMKGYISEEHYKGYVYHLENTVGLNALSKEHKARIFNIAYIMTKYILENDNFRSKLMAKAMSWGIRNRETLYPYLEKWFKSRLRNFIFGRKKK